MYREVAAYRTLNYSGIPTLIDTNAELFESFDPLFVITEHIPGPTLEQYISEGGPVDLDRGLNILYPLLEIVEYCHNSEIIHRDIKPDNIILKDGDSGQLFLIDFGLSFNKDIEERFTPISEQLTNRFLHLPELNNQLSKVDSRADITYCAGIFFYVLTGHYPQNLFDQNDRMPHQRDNVQEFFAKLPEPKATILKSIFDKAFNNHIDYRYQSVDALQQDLQKLSLASEEDSTINLETNLEKFRAEMHRRSDSDKRYSGKKVLEEASAAFGKAHGMLEKELGEEINSYFSGSQRDYNRYFISFKNGFQSGIDVEKKLTPKFTATIAGSEVIITLEQSGEEPEVFRVPVAGADWQEVTKFVRAYFLKRVSQLL
jgi:eukaryotic-like serine/threonine-protein kinase